MTNWRYIWNANWKWGISAMSSFCGPNMNVHRSGVLTAQLHNCYMAGTTWNCCRLGAKSMYTMQPCISLQCHFIRSHIRRVQVCLAVICCLHFWEKDRVLFYVLLQYTRVIGTDTEIMDWHRKLGSEEHSPAAPDYWPKPFGQSAQGRSWHVARRWDRHWLLSLCRQVLTIQCKGSGSFQLLYVCMCVVVVACAYGNGNVWADGQLNANVSECDWMSERSVDWIIVIVLDGFCATRVENWAILSWPYCIYKL